MRPAVWCLGSGFGAFSFATAAGPRSPHEFTPMTVTVHLQLSRQSRLEMSSVAQKSP
jgi:hypothetical protein